MDYFLTKMSIKQGDPTTLEDVKDRQNRPTQRAIITEAEPFLNEYWATNQVKAFQKDETYSEKKDPRNISTLEGVYKVMYSMYLYPVMDLFSSYSWYAFSTPPLQLAERVKEVTAKSFIETDFSRFDGNQNNATRCLESKFLTRFYAGENRTKALDLWRKGQNARGMTAKGVKYNTGASRLSGSPETSVFNTLINAFVAFYSFRLEGKSVDEAYKCLGYYGGDDGITPWTGTTASYERAAANCGLKIKCEVKTSGTYPVFLGRVYLDGYHSMIDIKRCLGKINISVGKVGNANQNLWNKWQGLLVTDTQTPIIANYCSRGCEILLASGFKPKDLDLSQKNPVHWAVWDKKIQFPQYEFEKNIQHVANILGQSYDWVVELNSKIQRSKTMDELFSETVHLTKNYSGMRINGEPIKTAWKKKISLNAERLLRKVKPKTTIEKVEIEMSSVSTKKKA
jgi:hypothetical protein